MSDLSRSRNSPQNNALLAAMRERRSTAQLGEPAPTDHELNSILAAAITVPDHGALRPWRFFVVSGDQRARFGSALRAAGVEHLIDPDVAVLDKFEAKAFVAPTMIVLVCTPSPGKVALWEQEASAASAGYAMVLAGHLLGLGAMWKSAPIRTGHELRDLFGLGPDDLLMGWVNLGAIMAPARDRRRPPEIDAVARRLTDDGPIPWEANELPPDTTRQSPAV